MANVKKMLKDGSMNIEMSQAVAGIKGTIFICESGETYSRVQVIEGQVELTDLKGNTTLLDAGQQVLVKNGTMGDVGAFLIDQELKNWPEKVSKQIYADIAERTGAKDSQEPVVKHNEEKLRWKKVLFSGSI